MTEQCGNCYYFREPDETRYGRCHRHAPKPYSFFRYYLAELTRSIAWSQARLADTLPDKDSIDDLNVEATETHMFSGWPETRDDDWCGEWKAKRLRRTTKPR